MVGQWEIHTAFIGRFRSHFRKVLAFCCLLQAWRGKSRTTPPVHKTKTPGAFLLRAHVESTRLADLLRRALAGVSVEHLLTQTERLRCRFHVLVRSDVLQSTFEAHDERRSERDALSVTLRAH